MNKSQGLKRNQRKILPWNYNTLEQSPIQEKAYNRIHKNDIMKVKLINPFVKVLSFPTVLDDIGFLNILSFLETRGLVSYTRVDKYWRQLISKYMEENWISQQETDLFPKQSFAASVTLSKCLSKARFHPETRLRRQESIKKKNVQTSHPLGCPCRYFLYWLLLGHPNR